MRYFIATLAGICVAILATRRSVAKALDVSESESYEQLPEPMFYEGLPRSAAQIATQVIEGAKDAAAGVSATLFGTPYDNLIQTAAKQAGIDAGLLYRVLYQESHFRPEIIDGRVRSKAGALGIAQFMPDTAREWAGSVEGALNPQVAIPAAARYLAWLIAQNKGNVAAAVASYNWGIGNVRAKGLAAAPSETREYVFAITGESIA